MKDKRELGNNKLEFFVPSGYEATYPVRRIRAPQSRDMCAGGNTFDYVRLQYCDFGLTHVEYWAQGPMDTARVAHKKC
jgi:hypothetical protein